MTVLKNPLKTDLIDFHSHILPGIDDGARSPDESLKMLELMAAQGVSKVVSTSHFSERSCVTVSPMYISALRLRISPA